MDLSLSDIPGRSSIVLYLWGCNFFCPYCHNKICLDPIAKREIEIPNLVSKILENRLSNALSVTGGEPLLQTDSLLQLIRLLREKRQDYYISIDTNGSFPENVKKVAPLVNRIAIDFKHEPGQYEKAVNRPIDPKKILESISIANETERLDIEVRTVLARPLVSFETIETIISHLKEISFRGTYVISQYIPSEGVDPQYKSQFFTEPNANVEEFINRLKNLPFKVKMRN